MTSDTTPSDQDELLGKVADAIWYEYARDDAPPVGQGDESMWVRYARAAIAAIPKPQAVPTATGLDGEVSQILDHYIRDPYLRISICSEILAAIIVRGYDITRPAPPTL